jgi:hypothetical protein
MKTLAFKGIKTIHRFKIIRQFLLRPYVTCCNILVSKSYLNIKKKVPRAGAISIQSCIALYEYYRLNRWMGCIKILDG